MFRLGRYRATQRRRASGLLSKARPTPKLAPLDRLPATRRAFVRGGALVVRARTAHRLGAVTPGDHAEGRGPADPVRDDADARARLRQRRRAAAARLCSCSGDGDLARGGGSRHRIETGPFSPEGRAIAMSRSCLSQGVFSVLSASHAKMRAPYRARPSAILARGDTPVRRS